MAARSPLDERRASSACFAADYDPNREASAASRRHDSGGGVVVPSGRRLRDRSAAGDALRADRDAVAAGPRTRCSSSRLLRTRPRQDGAIRSSTSSTTATATAARSSAAGSPRGARAHARRPLPEFLIVAPDGPGTWFSDSHDGVVPVRAVPHGGPPRPSRRSTASSRPRRRGGSPGSRWEATVPSRRRCGTRSLRLGRPRCRARSSRSRWDELRALQPGSRGGRSMRDRSAGREDNVLDANDAWLRPGGSASRRRLRRRAPRGVPRTSTASTGWPLSTACSLNERGIRRRWSSSPAATTGATGRAR